MYYLQVYTAPNEASSYTANGFAVRAVANGTFSACSTIVGNATPPYAAGCVQAYPREMMSVFANLSGTTAAVYLPGRDAAPLEVGAGSYRWSYAYAAPKADRPRLTLDSTLGELAEQPEAYARVMAIYAQHNLEYSYRMEGQLAVTLRQAARQNQYSDALAQRVQQALDETAG